MDDTAEPPPSEVLWTLAQPELDADELVPGKAAALYLRVAPEGSVVTFYGSTAMIPGPGTELSSPTVYGTGTTQGEGLKLEITIPADAPPEMLYFQAEVLDPHTGAVTWSTVAGRHVHVPPDASAVLLLERSEEAGLADIFTNGNSHTGGAAWLDYNGDHWPDLFVANGAGERQRLFRNNGDGTFLDVSDRVRKSATDQESAAACFADLENDGDVDLMVVVDHPPPLETELPMDVDGGPNLLYVNQGDGTFLEEAAPRGLVDPRGWRNITCSFADFDADGFVDLHVGTWAMNVPELEHYGRLLRNDGTGHYTDTAQRLGFGRDVLATLAADFDADGWTDLYLGNVNSIHDFVGTNPVSDDVFYLNDHGTLIESTSRSPGLGDDAWNAMGIDIGDVDNDGDFDLYETDRWDIPDTLPRGNPLYLNRGDGSFEDNSCDKAGICTGTHTWPANFADFDRDGWIDLYVGTSFVEDVDLMYVNRGDGTFASHLVRDFEAQTPRGSASADYDGDGDVDLFVWNLARDAQLFMNEPRDEHHWVELKLVGHRSNREAIGAVVRLSGAGAPQMRRVSGGDSAHSQSEAILHFGVADHTGPFAIDIQWPGGSTQHVEGILVDRLSFVDEQQGLRVETLESVTAMWTRAGTLKVAASTNFRGRSRLWLEGAELASTALSWNPDTLQFELELSAPATGELRLRNADGRAWIVAPLYSKP